MPSALSALTQEQSAIGPVGSTRAKQELGQDAFLKLMVTQLKNQDPFKPLEPQEFLGQLAQFSTVSGIQSIRDSVMGLSSTLQGSQVLQGATLVGRSVLAAGQLGDLGVTGEIAGAFGAPAGASSMQVRVVDANGSLVRTIDASPTAGLTEFSWDGRDARGDRVAPGTYRLEAVAGVGGREESVELLLQQRINSVTIDPAGGALRLNTSAGSIAMGDVRRIM